MIGPQLSLSLLLFYCLFLTALESEMFEAQNQQESGAMSSGEQHHMLARLVITFQSHGLSHNHENRISARLRNVTRPNKLYCFRNCLEECECVH